MDPHSTAPKKNTSHGNEVLPQDITNLIQRPCYQRGSPCQNPASNRTTRDLRTLVKRRKLQWYGHVCRSSALAKTILQGTVKGGRRQGRQSMRWEDSIREWTGPEFAKSPKAVDNREKNGRNWVWNHLWCPNDPRGQGRDGGHRVSTALLSLVSLERCILIRQHKTYLRDGRVSAVLPEFSFTCRTHTVCN